MAAAPGNEPIAGEELQPWLEAGHTDTVTGGVGAAPGGGFDKWQRLWTPHRLQYIRSGQEAKPGQEGNDCPFCTVPRQSEPESLIVYRGELAYVVLNLFPYNSGHLLVCPYRHVADYTELTDAEVVEIAALTQNSMTALRAAAGPHGFNIGMNQGAIAGAGVAAHLHQHVVPRWGGDINFMPIVGGSKTMPMLLAETRDLVAEYWPQAD